MSFAITNLDIIEKEINMKDRKKAIASVIFIIIFAVLFVYLVNHFSVITSVGNTLINIIFPFLLGCAIAFIINIPMSAIEKSLFKDENSAAYKYKRSISRSLAIAKPP